MDIKLATESVVANPTNLSYALIGCTTLILGYFTLFDGKSENGESASEPTPTKEESSKPSFFNMLNSDDNSKPKAEEPSIFDKFSKETSNDKNEPGIFDKLSESIMPNGEEAKQEEKKEEEKKEEEKQEEKKTESKTGELKTKEKG